MKLAIIILLGLVCVSCVHLTQSEKEMVQDLRELGIDPASEGDKSATAAGLLNILPGVGNIYLGQYGVFAANFFFWPVSIIWGGPQAAIDTEPTNQKATVDYYRTREGIAYLGLVRLGKVNPEAIPSPRQKRIWAERRKRAKERAERQKAW